MCIIDERIISMLEDGNAGEKPELKTAGGAESGWKPVESDEEVLVHLNQKVCI